MSIKKYSVTATSYGYGLDVSSGSENLPPEAVTVATNVRYNRNGGVFTRLGFESKASAIGSSAKVDTIFTHKPHNVMFMKSGTSIYQSLDGISWYSIGVTRTASERDFFYSYGKDVFVTNKTDAFLRIAVSTLTNAITGGSVTIDVRAGDGPSFTNGSDIVFIEGDSINYTATSSDQLTTVTNISASHAAGTIITQTSTPSGAPKGTCIADLEGSLLVGGVSAFPFILYYSAPSTLSDPQFAYDFSANGAGTKKMPADITALGSVSGGVLIGMKKGIHYADQFQIDTGALITRPLTETHGMTNAFCFAQGDNKTYAHTNTKRVLPIISDADGVRIIDDQSSERNNIDYPVRSFLTSIDAEQDLSFSHYDPVSAEVTYSVFKDGISQELVYNEDLGKWSIDVGQTFGCKTNFKDRVYAGSDSTDTVFLANEGTTDDGITILHRILSPLYTVDDKRVTSDYLKFTFGGLLSGVGAFTFRIYVNGALAETVDVTAEDLQAKNLMSLASGVPLGGGTIGAHTIGSSGSTPEVYPFTFPFELFLSGEQIQFEWEINDEGCSFELRDSRLDAEHSGELYSDAF